MSRKVLVNLDLNKNQIQNAVAHVLSTAPASPVEGQYYWNSVVKAWMIYNGSGWQQSGSDYNLPPASDTALGGIMASDSIAVDEDTGEATVVDNSHNHTASNISDFSTAVQNATGDSFVGASYNSTNGVITFTNRDGTTDTVDLPLELLVQSGSYNSTTQNIELVLANGSKIEIPAGDLVDEYKADGTTITLNTSTNTFSVKDGVYQTKLTFDQTPTEGSSNPVVSGAIYTALAGKQATLSTTQLAATNSGITSTLVTQIGTNKSNIEDLQSDKQDALTTTQLAAVNSGVTSSVVSQVTTNKNNISALQSLLSASAAVCKETNPALTPSGGVCTWSIDGSIGDSTLDPTTTICKVYETATGAEILCDIIVSGSTISVKINSASTIAASTYTFVGVGLLSE